MAGIFASACVAAIDGASAAGGFGSAALVFVDAEAGAAAWCENDTVDAAPAEAAVAARAATPATAGSRAIVFSTWGVIAGAELKPSFIATESTISAWIVSWPSSCAADIA